MQNPLLGIAPSSLELRLPRNSPESHQEVPLVSPVCWNLPAGEERNGMRPDTTPDL